MAQLQSIFPELPKQSCAPSKALPMLQTAKQWHFFLQPGTDELGLVHRGFGGTWEKGYFCLL